MIWIWKRLSRNHWLQFMAMCWKLFGLVSRLVNEMSQRLQLTDLLTRTSEKTRQPVCTMRLIRASKLPVVVINDWTPSTHAEWTTFEETRILWIADLWMVVMAVAMTWLFEPCRGWQITISIPAITDWAASSKTARLQNTNRPKGSNLNLNLSHGWGSCKLTGEQNRRVSESESPNWAAQFDHLRNVCVDDNAIERDVVFLGNFESADDVRNPVAGKMATC